MHTRTELFQSSPSTHSGCTNGWWTKVTPTSPENSLLMIFGVSSRRIMSSLEGRRHHVSVDDISHNQAVDALLFQIQSLHRDYPPARYEEIHGRYCALSEPWHRASSLWQFLVDTFARSRTACTSFSWNSGSSLPLAPKSSEFFRHLFTLIESSMARGLDTRSRSPTSTCFVKNNPRSLSPLAAFTWIGPT